MLLDSLERHFVVDAAHLDPSIFLPTMISRLISEVVLCRREIVDRRTIHLHHMGFDLDFVPLGLARDGLEERLYGARTNALQLRRVVRTHHREGLAGAGLAVSKDRDVVAVEHRLHQIPAFHEDLLLRGLWAECRVELELVFVALLIRALHRHPADDVDDDGAVKPELTRVEGSDPAEDARGTEEVLQHVVHMPALQFGLKHLTVCVAEAQSARHRDGP
mmetsp:Transcript_85212/g.237906  ORF Transcript_85212/g.237906 Transcript_85212/m.237906 type:complete len:219 (-) Transcript_85212:2787-3443(-)